jgi:hypothetical protein
MQMQMQRNIVQHATDTEVKKRKPWKFQAMPMEQIKEVAKWNGQKGP